MYRPQMPLWKRVLMSIAMVIATIWLIFPIYWAVITSLKKPADVFKLSFIPFVQFKPTLENWQTELTLRAKEVFRPLSTSFIVAISRGGALAIGALAGYGLARFLYQRWRIGTSPWILRSACLRCSGHPFPDDASWINSPLALILSM